MLRAGGSSYAWCADESVGCGAASLTVESSTFQNNSAATYGGGGHAFSNAALAVAGSVFDGNSAVISGGAITFDGGNHDFSVAGTVVTGNGAGECGAVAVLTARTVTLSDMLIAGNAASAGNGGGMCLMSSPLTKHVCVAGQTSSLVGPSGDISVVSSGELMPTASSFTCDWHISAEARASPGARQAPSPTDPEP